MLIGFCDGGVRSLRLGSCPGGYAEQNAKHSDNHCLFHLFSSWFWSDTPCAARYHPI